MELTVTLLILDVAQGGKDLLHSFLEPLALLGFLGQAIFATRFIVQWYVSEKKKQSVVPKVFWYLSLGGSVLLVIYASLKPEPVLFIGQLPGFIVYTRNLILLSRAKATLSTPA